MADNRSVYPLGLGMDQAAAAEEPAADPASATPIFGHRLGCALHVLQLAVTAGMTNPCFMGPLGISRSNTCNATLTQFQNLITKHFVPEGTLGRLRLSSLPRLDGWWSGRELSRVFGADGGATSGQGHAFQGPDSARQSDTPAGRAELVLYSTYIGQMLLSVKYF